MSTDVDMTILMVEPIASVGSQEQALLEQLKGKKSPIVLVINKIDTLEEKTKLLTCIAAWQQEYAFEAIVPLSALTGEGTGELLDELSRHAFESPHFFPDDAVSDQPEKVIAAELLREQMLLLMRDEIPHGIAVLVENLEERDTERGTILDIEATIFCERESHKGMVIGKKGAMLKRIAGNARQQMEALFDTKVNLQCWVKVKEDWRNRQGILNGLGYRL